MPGPELEKELGALFGASDDLRQHGERRKGLGSVATLP